MSEKIVECIECDCGYVFVMFNSECDRDNVKAFDWKCGYCGKKLIVSEYTGKENKSEG